jgi:hypothetical protein
MLPPLLPPPPPPPPLPFATSMDDEVTEKRLFKLYSLDVGVTTAGDVAGDEVDRFIPDMMGGDIAADRLPVLPALLGDSRPPPSSSLLLPS